MWIKGFECVTFNTYQMLGVDLRPYHVWGKEYPPPIGQRLEQGQLKLAEQLLGDGLEGEVDASHEHPLMEQISLVPGFKKTCWLPLRKLRRMDSGMS